MKDSILGDVLTALILITIAMVMYSQLKDHCYERSPFGNKPVYIQVRCDCEQK